MIGQLEEFARRVSQELQEPDWDTRREVVRALVKKVEIDEQEVRIVYRVSPSPFERGPQQGSLQHCWGRDSASTWKRCVAWRVRTGNMPARKIIYCFKSPMLKRYVPLFAPRYPCPPTDSLHQIAPSR